MLGNMRVGHYFRGNLSDTGCAAIRSSDVTRTALTMLNSNIYLPRHSQELNIPIVPLGKLGKAGPVHRSIGQFESSAPTKRGVFQLFQYEGIQLTCRLWSHISERKNVVGSNQIVSAKYDWDTQEADCLEGIPLRTSECEFRLTSKPCCMHWPTNDWRRAWPSFYPLREKLTYPSYCGEHTLD